jgi:Mn2+/Fe2+ NRAMP family transporter
VLTAATPIGLSLNLVKIDPIRALFWSAIINGVVAVPVMVVVMLLSANRRVMGEFSVPILLKIIGWIATAAMFLATVAMFVTLRH